MGKRTFLTAAAVSAAASALIGGVPAVVILKSGLTQGGEGTREEAASAEQTLTRQLAQAGATKVKRFTLVNSLAATVSTAEQQRLAADPAVAEVIPDTTFTVQDPVASVAQQAAASAPPATRTRLATPTAPTTWGSPATSRRRAGPASRPRLCPGRRRW